MDVFPVTAAAHMSGPYSLSMVMLEKFLSDEPRGNVADIVFMLLGYQSAYQNIFESLSDVFREPYIPIIEDFYNNQYALTTLEIQLTDALLLNEGLIVANKMLQPTFLDELNDPTSEIMGLIRENDTYNWAPDAPTRLYYCSADERVPARNSTLADSVLNQNGAINVASIDVNSTASHGDCTFSALLTAKDFFLSQLAAVSIKKESDTPVSLKIFPNPAQQYVQIDGFELPFYVEILSVSGQVKHQTPIQWSNRIDLTMLQNGLYYLKIKTKDLVEIHPIQVHR
jgi:hypothetical protein